MIIPVLNGERTIRECLVSLLRVDYPPGRWEILVVDNGSADRTAEIVKSFPVRYLQEERRGVSHARNRAIEASKCEILAFTDPDCVVSTGWLHDLVQAFEEECVGGVGGDPSLPINYGRNSATLVLGGRGNE
ncbi:glycosyltransferase family 2 protein [Nitrospinae bacterium AH_259_B05_G02_I21]|nr:glycosyltransferase family 2 protein [Nitrospinae bacterium AH_259_B05_G02_I21]MDA2931701.1 glycosyltransferase family 2 protein [Nitrospinae bacterium AH-259-F20]